MRTIASTNISSEVYHKLQGGRPPTRHASSDSRPLYKKLWTIRPDQEEATSKPNDFNPHPSFLGEGGGNPLGFSGSKIANEMKLRCTEFDENGNVTLVSGEFKKSELIAKVHQLSIFAVCYAMLTTYRSMGSCLVISGK